MPRHNLIPLDSVDPVQAWKAWEPDAKQPWNLKWAAHLYRRAAFGANLVELREAVRQGHAATLDRLVEGNRAADEAFNKFMAATGKSTSTRQNSFQLRGWWLYAMLNTPYPLREKLTLFWHNHFATSIAKVRRTEMMQKQNQLLREHALGKFEPMLQAIAKDPAMLVWLDSNSNVKGKANENFARELMELFSLGVGHYSEKDIREAARAFTGWQEEDGDHGPEWVFVPKFHDDGAKTVLKETGNWNGEDIVRIVLKQDDAARFLIGKLYRCLVSETDPPAALLEPLAVSFRQSGYDVGQLVKTMLRSRHFFSDHAYRRRIKDPVEYVLGTVQAAARRDANRQLPVPPVAIVSRLDAMGMQLFAPPNVKGWPGGRTWLNTSTVLARTNFAQQVAGGTLRARPNEGSSSDDRAQLEAFLEEQQRQAEEQARQAQAAQGEDPAADPKLDLAAVVQAEGVKGPAQIVDLLLDLLLDGNASPAARARLIAHLSEGKPEGVVLDRRIRGTAHAIMAMPEYQLA